MSKIEVTAALCEIELKDGSTCGVTAIGRCATCDHAFCLTHQGRIYDNFHGWITYVDMCASCLAVKQAEEAKRKKEAQVPYNYFMSGAARTDLLTTGVPTIEIYQIGKKWKTKWGLLGRRYEQVDIVVPFGRGWILGEFEWHYDRNTSGGGESDYVDENWLTALLDLPSDDPRLPNSYFSTNSTLARVRPYSGGYENLLRQHNRFRGDWQTGLGWREAMLAVRQLAGIST